MERNWNETVNRERPTTNDEQQGSIDHTTKDEGVSQLGTTNKRGTTNKMCQRGDGGV